MWHTFRTPYLIINMLLALENLNMVCTFEMKTKIAQIRPKSKKKTKMLHQPYYYHFQREIEESNIHLKPFLSGYIY